MRSHRELSWTDVEQAAHTVAFDLMEIADENKRGVPEALYGVPRGGIFAAQALARQLVLGCDVRPHLVESPDLAELVVDDIIATGATRDDLAIEHPGVPFVALFNKADFTDRVSWVSFPWERATPDDKTGIENNISRLLEYIGEDPQREGLAETPDRVARAWTEELFVGYSQDPHGVLKTFEDGACNEMVVLSDIEFYSHCEHHIMPFYGHAHIGYIPDGRVVGVSKLARLLEVFTRRLQIQERIGQQVTAVLQSELKPKGCGCVLEATHFCMTSRGVQKQHSRMVTSSLRGCFDKAEVRAEFLRLIGK